MQIRGRKKENIAQAGRGSSAPTNGSVLSTLTEHPFFSELLAEIADAADGQELGKRLSWVRQRMSQLKRSLRENSPGVMSCSVLKVQASDINNT